MSTTLWRRGIVLLVLLALAGTSASWAQGEGLNPRRLTYGWEQIDTHVFQRLWEDGTLQTVGWGQAMVAWQLEHVQERIADLERRAAASDQPSIELLEALSYERAEAVELAAELAGDGLPELSVGTSHDGVQSMAGALGCTLVVTRDAFAFPTSTGPAARATAAFSDSCNTFGKVKAKAYAEGIEAGAFRSSSEDDPATGRRSGFGGATASAAASVVASTDCFSRAEARVWIQDANGNMVPFVNVVFNWDCRIVFPDPWPGDCLSGVGLQACSP